MGAFPSDCNVPPFRVMLPLTRVGTSGDGIAEDVGRGDVVEQGSAGVDRHGVAAGSAR